MQAAFFRKSQTIFVRLDGAGVFVAHVLRRARRLLGHVHDVALGFIKLASDYLAPLVNLLDNLVGARSPLFRALVILYALDALGNDALSCKLVRLVGHFLQPRGELAAVRKRDAYRGLGDSFRLCHLEALFVLDCLGDDFRLDLDGDRIGNNRLHAGVGDAFLHVRDDNAHVLLAEMVHVLRVG